MGQRPSRREVRLPRSPAVGPTAILFCLTACAGSGGSRPVPPTPVSECLLAAAGGPVADSLVIGVPDSVEVARSVPRSDGEALVLRLLGRTGEIRPCAAAGETSEASSWRVVMSRGDYLALVPALIGGIPRLFLRVEPGADPRALLDRGADLLVTRDRATIEYGANLGDHVTLPLAWDRAYVMAAPQGAEIAAVTSGESDWTQAVRGDARKPEGEAWWETGHCRGEDPAPHGPGLRYTAGDATARALAERVAALAARRGITLAPGPADLGSAAGGPTIVALPLARPESCAGVPAIPASWQLIPLVETRAHVIMRRGAAVLVADPDGGLRIAASLPGAGQPQDAETDR